VAAVKKFLDMYRDTAEKAGYTASPEQLGWMAPVYVGDTDASARAEAKPHIEAFSNKFLRMKPEMVRPPGYLSLASAQAVLDAKASQSGESTIDALIERGQFICGSVETVRQRIAEYERLLGLGNFLALVQFGTLPHDATMRNIERIARDVLPHFRTGPESAPAPSKFAPAHS
jgi:alkanesulfonate monooxygenase SsuD/methylene tetrahydromethanopterin reductase-like flavin-dependent oxidoreductase (luciferase family)